MTEFRGALHGHRWFVQTFMATYRMVNGAELIYWEMIDFVHDQFLTKYFLTVENLSLGINVSKHLDNSWHRFGR
jgi:hypothetical protein